MLVEEQASNFIHGLQLPSLEPKPSTQIFTTVAKKEKIYVEGLGSRLHVHVGAACIDVVLFTKLVLRS